IEFLAVFVVLEFAVLADDHDPVDLHTTATATNGLRDGAEPRNAVTGGDLGADIGQPGIVVLLQIQRDDLDPGRRGRTVPFVALDEPGTDHIGVRTEEIRRRDKRDLWSGHNPYLFLRRAICHRMTPLLGRSTVPGVRLSLLTERLPIIAAPMAGGPS